MEEELSALEMFRRDLEQGEYALLSRSRGYLSFISRRGYWLDGVWG